MNCILQYHSHIFQNVEHHEIAGYQVHAGKTENGYNLSLNCLLLKKQSCQYLQRRGCVFYSLIRHLIAVIHKCQGLSVFKIHLGFPHILVVKISAQNRST